MSTRTPAAASRRADWRRCIFEAFTCRRGNGAVSLAASRRLGLLAQTHGVPDQQHRDQRERGPRHARGSATGSRRASGRAAAAGAGCRPRGRPPGPAGRTGRGRRRRAAAASTTSAGCGGLPVGRAAPPAVREVRRVEGVRRRPRQPGEQPAAQDHVADQADADRGEVETAGGDAVRDGQRDDEQDAADEREPRRAGLEVAVGDRLAARQPALRRGCVSIRSLCQPRIAWPTSTVASTRPTSRPGRPLIAAAIASPAAVRTACRGWAARSSRTGVVWASVRRRSTTGRSRLGDRLRSRLSSRLGGRVLRTAAQGGRHTPQYQPGTPRPAGIRAAGRVGHHTQCGSVKPGLWP